MNALRIITQGLRPGLQPLAIATQGFQPLRYGVFTASGSDARARHLRRLREDDEAIIAMLGAFAAGVLNA
jgi:hypothetical protein